MSAATQQVTPGQEAGRPQPQTTVEPAGGPFIRHSRPGRRTMYQTFATPFGATVQQPLNAVPGYIRGFRVRVNATGGVDSGETVAVNADAPFNCVGQVTLRDAFGTPLIVAPGYEALYLIPKYSSEYGLGSAADIKNMPTYTAPVVGSNASGNFAFSTYLPMEFNKGIGCVSGANASLLPSLQINYAGAATVYSVQPDTPPTIETDVNADFYWLPEGVAIEPPALGTTCQWVLQQCNPTIGNASTATVTLPRLGGFLHTIILILRDSTGARIDGYGTRVRIYVDGVPVIDSRFDELQDDVYNIYGGITRDTGVIPLSFRTSLSQVNLGLLDTGESYISTNPGTSIAVECSPWGSISNAPAVLSCLVGQVVPSGSLIQGLPEL